MSSRYEEIDRFLKFVAEKRKGENDIYHELEIWNIPENERVFESSDMYVYDNAGIDFMSSTNDENWFKRMGYFNTFLLYNFGDYTITDYFSQKGENHFLRFYNPEIEADIKLRKSEPIKMYMSLGKEDAFYFLFSLMKFCENNRILHNSKLAQSIRNDDVVLRVYSLNDAEKIANYIKDGGFELNNPNPFCLTDGKIGYAMDSGKSYNKYVAETIEKYLSKLDEPQKAGYEDFRKYTESLETNEIKDERKLLSLKLALDPTKTIQDFYKSWNKIINPDEPEADTDEGLEKQREYERTKRQERLKKEDNNIILQERENANNRRNSLKQKLEVMRTANASVKKGIPSYITIITESKEEYEARKKKEEENEIERKKMIKDRLQRSKLVSYMDELAKSSTDKYEDSEFSKSVQKFRKEYDLDNDER